MLLKNSCCSSLIAILVLLWAKFGFHLTKADDVLQRAEKFVKEFDRQFKDIWTKWQGAMFNMYTNKNDETTKKTDLEKTKHDAIAGKAAKEAADFDLELLKGRPDIVIQLKFIRAYAISLDSNDRRSYNDLISKMSDALEAVKICARDQNGKIVANCAQKWNQNEAQEAYNKTLLKNPDLQLQLWEDWNRAVGKALKTDYQKFVDLSNKGAIAIGFNSYTNFWKASYVYQNIEALFDKLWLQLLPFYEQLHAHVHRKLKASSNYNKKIVGNKIPMEIFGLSYIPNWQGIKDLVLPYPNLTYDIAMDVQHEMEKQGYNVQRLLKLADQFFQSLGLPPMNENFWNKSVFEKPSGEQNTNCPGKEFDLNDRDNRFHFCAKVDYYWYQSIHRNMAGTHYGLSFADLPGILQNNPLPGFFEAIGWVIEQCVSTPEHLKSIGLLQKYQQSVEQDINDQMNLALTALAELPYHLILDKWRYGVFSGAYTFDKWQESWANFVNKYQGLSIPKRPSEKDEFDAAVDSRISSSTEAMPNFLGRIIEFQVYKSLCNAAGHNGPLHHCDFKGSKAAGKILSDAMKLGQSKPWQDVMQILTGQREIDAAAFLEYFTPLLKWLTKENQNAKACYRWTYQMADCFAKPALQLKKQCFIYVVINF